MSKKSILITGCSSGIGLASAKSLRAHGWTVFAAARKPEDCARLEADGFCSPLLDYAQPETINEALQIVLQNTGGTLDALFNNGAFAIPGAVEDLPTEALRSIFDANFFGWHELTRQVIPVMRAQGHGRIVQCSSVLGFVTAPWRGAYTASKFALEGLTDTLRMEMRDTNVKVVLIEPGPITTDFRKNASAQFERWIDWESSARKEQYEQQLIPRMTRSLDRKDRFELAPEAVARKLITALEAPNPKPRYFVTTPTYIAAIMRRLLPNRALDWVLSRG